MLLIRYGRKLSQKELMNRDLDGEEAEELAGEFDRGLLPCVQILKVIYFVIMALDFFLLWDSLA